MAITVTHIATSGSPTNTTSYSTGSLTPPANSLVLVSVGGARGAPTTTPTVSGWSVTWEVVGTPFNTAGVVFITYRAVIGASPPTGALTITYGTTEALSVWSITAFSGPEIPLTNNGADAIRQVVENSGTTTGPYSVSLPNAFGDAANVSYGVLSLIEFNGTPPTVTPGASYSELGEHNENQGAVQNDMTIEAQYRIADADPSWTVTGTHTGWAAVGIEIGQVATQDESGSAAIEVDGETSAVGAKGASAGASAVVEASISQESASARSGTPSIASEASVDSTGASARASGSALELEAAVAAAGVAAVYPVITNVDPDEVSHGSESVITGQHFGATQGTGRVVLSPTDDINDVDAVEATVVAWSDAEITAEWDTTGLI